MDEMYEHKRSHVVLSSLSLSLSLSLSCVFKGILNDCIVSLFRKNQIFQGYLLCSMNNYIP